MNQLKLPRETTLESLYQIGGQSIWFFIWVLKQERLWPDLIKDVLEAPFTVIREYFPSGQLKFLETVKQNKRYHGIRRYWYNHGQIMWKSYWKNQKLDGPESSWGQTGQLLWEKHWKDGN